MRTHSICRNRGNNHPAMSLHRSGTAWAQEGVACRRCNHPPKQCQRHRRHVKSLAMPGHVRQMHPAKALLCAKGMRPEFQCATMCAGTSSGQTPSITLYLAHKPMFDKRASPVLSRSAITKYVTPKPRGGCEANAHLDKHERIRGNGPLA